MKLKKLITLSILTVFCLVSFIPVNSAAEENPSISTMADALNKLGILQGSNGNYLLSNNLKRSEAMTFITRVLGREDYVKENVEQYQSTSFPDVPEDAWYAPYVGFCAEKELIAGDTAGKFNPEAYITEKAFLKILLCTLGYTYGEDFDWSNVYRTAWDKGIVKDDSYITRTQDQANYKRSDVVNALYNTLSVKKKDSDVTLLQSLIRDGLITRDAALAAGVINDAVPMKIDAITVSDRNHILVNLNEDLDEITDDQIRIFETGNPSSRISVEELTVDGDKIEIQISSLRSLKEYTIELNDVADLEGNLSGKISNTFKTSEITSDYFRISNVEAVTENRINVYFTHPVNSNSEQASYYTIQDEDGDLDVTGSQHLAVGRLQNVGNGVSILLKSGSLNEDTMYTIQVNGKLTSLYGVKLNEGKGEDFDFVGSSSEEDRLAVKKISAPDSGTLSIEFNKEIDPAFFVQKPINYTITGPDDENIAVIGATVGGDGDKKGKIILLKLDSKLVKNQKYKLRAEYISDIYRKDVLEETEYSFSGSYGTTAVKMVKSVGSTDKDSVSVKFNMAMDPATVTKTDLYYIKSASSESFYSTPAKVYYYDYLDQHIATLYLPKDELMKSNGRYKLEISGTLKDSSGAQQVVNQELSFTGGSGNVQKPYITDAVSISKDSIKITLSKDIAADVPNIINSNYVLEYTEDGESMKLSPTSITYIDSRTLVLRFDEFDLTGGATLKFSVLKDYAGVYTRTAADGTNSIKVKQGK